ncbi:MAG: hypothetical protein ACSLEW_07415 [Nocardioides sp.]
MTMTHSDNLLAAMRDAESLVPWAKDNDIVLQIPSIEQTVRESLGGPVLPGCEVGIPLLRVANSGADAVPLVGALLTWDAHRVAACDRHEEARADHRLAVVAGASVVLMHFCDDCKSRMDHAFPALVWS